MRTLRYLSLTVTLMLLACIPASAQKVDSRGRVTSTIIADGLAQLPTKNLKDFNQYMGEMAGTGQEGVEMLVGMLEPHDQGKNAKFEYAISGIVNYVSAPENASLREGVRKGLVAGLGKTTDKVNKAFIVAQLQRIVTRDDVPTLASLLSDPDLRTPALTALAAVPDCNEDIIALMQKEAAPRAELAHLAFERGMNDATTEGILLSWLKGADASTTAAVYNALSICNGKQTFKTLQKAAKAVAYGDDAAGATDAYLRLLEHYGKVDAKSVAKAAAELQKSGNQSIRNEGLILALENMTGDRTATVVKALQDGNRQYRNAALNTGYDLVGNSLLSSVSGKMTTLPTAAQVDVVRWLGSHEAKDCVATAIGAISSSDNELAESAIDAASKIGGNDALKAIVAQLGGQHAAKASEALLSFNGDITSGILKALDNSNANLVKQALQLASTRHISSAYDKVLGLTRSADNSVSTAAYTALKGVAQRGNFDQLCDLLDQTGTTHLTALQEAAAEAIQQEAPATQYRLVSGRMAKAKDASRYYPLLAQAGNSDAIETLIKGYADDKTADAAFQSLLKVDNSEMIDILYAIAANDASTVNNILPRYLELVKKSDNNDVRKYQLLSKALELKPSAAVANQFIEALSAIHNWPSLQTVAAYLGQADNAMTAANAVRTIAGKNADLQKGAAVKRMLQQAKDVFAAQKNDPDAGYAVDEINNLLPKVAENGFTDVTADLKTVKKNTLQLPGKYENFELWLDWKSEKSGTLSLRSMPELQLDGTLGASYIHADETTTGNVNTPGEWNTLYVRVVNDRLWVESNGQTVADNVVLKNTPTSKEINVEGLIAVLADVKQFQVRNVAVNQLPATPVYTLSAEEKAQGFELLFDGRSLNQWHGDTQHYVPEGGSVYVSANFGGTGNLYTNKKYGDFIYRFEFCFVKPGVNNGIGIRTKDGTNAAYDGMEIQVLDHDDPIYKDLRPYQQHGSVYGVIVPKHIKFGPLGTWNTEEIRAVGDHITVTVNGQVLVDGNIREACQGHNVAPDGSNNNPYTVDHSNHPGLFNPDGFISFCGHGEGVRFRAMRVLDLNKQAKATSKQKKTK